MEKYYTNDTYTIYINWSLLSIEYRGEFSIRRCKDLESRYYKDIRFKSRPEALKIRRRVEISRVQTHVAHFSATPENRENSWGERGQKLWTNFRTASRVD